MEYITWDVFEETNKKNLNINKPFKNKELIQKKEQIKNNQRHSKIINLILFEITLIILSKINIAFGLTIQIKVNKIGANQIISDNYEGTLPKIYINNIDAGIGKIKNIENINYIIQLWWENSISDLSYLFYDLDSITYFDLNYITNEVKNINITRMFYNCKNIKTIIFDNIYNRMPDISASLRNVYYYPVDLSYAFYNCISLTNLQLFYFRTHYTQEIKYMFFNCNKLEAISFTDCYFANTLITNMKGIFQNCESLTSLNLATFYTPKVIIMWDMFKNCKNLTSLNVANFNTSNVIDMESMFEGCEKLISLNLTKFRTPKVHYMNKMFLGCTKLQSLDFNYINSDNLGSMDLMFSNCNNLKYLNLFSLTEKAQSIADIFEGSSNDFKYCINDYEKIPNILKELFVKSNTRPDCSIDCYKDNNIRPYNSYKKVCCPKFLYEDTCCNKCPPKFEANESNICVKLNCPKYLNYTQDGCEDEMPVGYYQNDSISKTIDKCHENCLTCDRGPTDNINYCTSCNRYSSLPFLYLDNCTDSCPNNRYSGPYKCKCEIEECLDCNYESLKQGLCTICAQDYYPKDNDNYGNYSKCYKNPLPKYYLYNRKYKPCYPSCESCNGEGNDNNHHCIKCDANYTVKFNDRINNCYENCTYYYYFDNDDIYRCTEKDECPNDFKFLIKELRKCVKSCSITDYKTQFSYGCYKECPLNISEPRERIPYSCRPLCTYEFPFELIPEEKCVANCSIMERSEKLCITNYFGNRSNLEIQELIRVDIERDLEIEFNYTIITENQTVLIEENQTNYEIVTTRNKNPNSNTTKINLGECEKVLKDFYDIPQDDYLYMLIIDAYVEGKTGPVTLYEVYYPLFNSKTLYKLDLSFCKGLKINVLYNIPLENPELYNKNHFIYNDVCHPYSSREGLDMGINDLRDEYIKNNRSICEEGCDFVGYFDGYVECNCDVKESTPNMEEIKIDKNKLYKFMNLKNVANFGVLKCTNLFYAKERMISNIGLYSFIPTLIVYILCLIIFYKRDFDIIKNYIKDILNAIQTKNYLDKEKEKENQKRQKYKNGQNNQNGQYNQNNQNNLNNNENAQNNKNSQYNNQIFKEKYKKIQLNELEPIIISIAKAKKVITNETDEYNINLNLSKNDSKIQFNKVSSEINNNTEIDSKSIFNTNNDIFIVGKKGKKLTLKKNLKFLNKIKFDKNPSLQFNSSNNDDIDRAKINKSIEEKDIEKVKQILSLSEKELNEFNFKKAIKYDKRNFFEIYFSFIKMEHILIKIFNSKDYNSLMIKIYLFFYNFNLNYAVNALFFNEGTIHQILEEEGKFNFLYQLPQILYSSIISYFLGMILENFALSEDEIIDFKGIKVVKIALNKAKKLIIILWIKSFHFFLLSFLMLILFWYYVICFCVVYTNTQHHLIKDTLIGFGTGLLSPFGMKIIPALFRLIGIKKKNKYFFLISKLMQIFL